MRRAIAALLLAAAILVSLLVGPAAAENVTNITTPVAFTGTNPCQPGDLIALSGELHILVTATETGSGGFFTTWDTNTQNLQGTSLSTGTRYTASTEALEHNAFTAGPPLPYSQTIVESHELISQGSTQNFRSHMTVRWTIDAAGVPSVIVENVDLDCSG